MERPALAWTLAFALSPAALAQAEGLWGDGGELRDALSGIRGQAAELRLRTFETPRAYAGAERPSPERYPVRGIDVSHHQDLIDWREVKGAGIAFAYLKATEGSDWADPEFARNWRGAAEAGLLRGAYHFYNFCKTGAEQAEHFIRTVPADPGALPPTVDLERSESCPRMPRVSELRYQLAIFLAKVRKAYGKRPILYATREVYESYLEGWSDPDRLWMTSASGSPRFPDGVQWLIWQHSDRGRVDGVPWRVDMNVFNGGREQLAALAEPDPSMSVALLGR